MEGKGSEVTVFRGGAILKERVVVEKKEKFEGLICRAGSKHEGWALFGSQYQIRDEGSGYCLQTM